jgi:hypothetical protein
VRRVRAGLALLACAALAGCAGLVPLRDPPPDPPGAARTHDELVRQFGRPAETLPWARGKVVVYRRVLGFSADPGRLSRADPVEARILIYVDREGRIVRVERPPR